MANKQISSDGYCFVCGGKGLLDEKCPSCGREPKKLSFSFEEDSGEKFIQKVDAINVPGKYRGIMWNPDVLRKSFRDKEHDSAFQRFVNQLDKVDSVFASGILSDKSAIIIAPAGYSKMTFAYSCMQRAIDAGFSVAPMLDTSELKRLLYLSSENPTYKLYNNINYDDYIMSDVCFITVTKMATHEWAYNTIQEILDRRARKGLGTFVISRFSLAEISKRDLSNQFSVISTASSQDDFRYPAVISYQTF